MLLGVLTWALAVSPAELWDNSSTCMFNIHDIMLNEALPAQFYHCYVRSGSIICLVS